MSLLTFARRLFLQHFTLHDAAWKPTGIRPMTEWSYDEALAVAGARRAKRRSATGRVLAKPRAPIANVVRLQRRAVSK